MKKWNTKTRPAISGSRGLFAWLVGLALPLLGACADGGSDGSGRPEVGPEPDPVPFQEIYDQGVLRYLGQYTPMLSEQVDDLVTHTFGTGDGPQCLYGAPYSMSTRDAGSENLVIFLKDGGGCWSEFCAASSEADPVYIKAGILDPERANNPVKDWNVAYLPYCDGGLHASDKDNDYDGDGTPETFQRGLHNLSASLDIAVNTFPSPRRILLAGQSGGGFGTDFALPLVRSLYPGIPIDVVNDSGVGLGRPGQPEFLELLIDDFNLGAFIPASCTDCIADNGHLTNYHIWQMDQDPDVHRGMLSYSRDSTLADFFLMIGKDAFEAALFEEMPKLEAAHPERSRYWIPAGDGHVVLQPRPDLTAGGVVLMDWVSYMLDRSDEWLSVQD